MRNLHRWWAGMATLVLIVGSAVIGARVDRQADQVRPVPPEEVAIAAGERLGIGRARLEGPKSVQVLTHQTWTLVFTAGKAGLPPGGGLRVAMRHVHCWSPPQTNAPKQAGYVTLAAPEGCKAKLTVSARHNRLWRQYFPWQHLIEVTIGGRALKAGEELRIVLGDRSGGGPGMRVQPFDESPFVFKCFVDATGDGEYLPLRENPAIEITPAEPARLAVVMPSDAVIGRPTWCLVRAQDRYGNPATSYRGTVRLRSSDAQAQLPPPYTFTEKDRGVHRFEAVVFDSAGVHTVSAKDGQFDATGNPVRVTETRPERLLLWGDLHGHTLFSDGRGTVEQFYDFAKRVAGLDFCAVTDHAFEILDPMWKHSKEVTNRFNEPGRFVTFQAFEWSGVTAVGGDHNVYFLEEDPPIYRSTSYYDPRNYQMYHGRTPKVAHVTELFEKLEQRLRDKNVFCIPHYGGRRGNPKWHNEKVQRMIEIFSEHRRSEDWATTFLTKGHRLGIMASTDDHFGNPGYGYLKPSYRWDEQEIGMAAVAVYSQDRTRESIFRALYDRRVYATSGDRIVLDFRADGHPMGSEYRTRMPPILKIDAVGTASIVAVQIKKNSQVVHEIRPRNRSVRIEWRDPDFDPDSSCYYYVRVLQDNGEEAISSPIWVN
ncbi:MAG: DUF3604 domain-containing protein [Planctomycetes bacterium]|nr:DUF3604 domain-containing protein [Planctomycetota bacterium]